MASEAFDLAEQFQTPVFVMIDLDLGMNNWMSDPFAYPDKPINRGKVLTRRGSGEAGRLRALQGRGRRRHRLSHAARPPIIRRRRTSRAAAATTKRRSTPSAKTITSTTWTGWRTSSKPCASTFLPPVVDYNAKAKIGFIALRHVALRGGREPRPVAREYEIETSYLRLRAYPFNDGAGGFHPPARARLRGRSESRRAAAGADAAGADAGAIWRSCEAYAITAGCRSTRAPSPTNSSARRASK